jgi:hypothetical protein
MLSLNKITLLWMQRFIPSEFGMDPSKMGHALELGRVTFDEKMDLRRAIEEANIPHTYVSANCFAGKFCANLCQMCTLLPRKEKVHVYGDGNVKGKTLYSACSSPPPIIRFVFNLTSRPIFTNVSLIHHKYMLVFSYVKCTHI